MSINHFILLNKSLSNKNFDITIVKDPFIEAPIAQTVERRHSVYYPFWALTMIYTVLLILYFLTYNDN
jgi:hypothetical protein